MLLNSKSLFAALLLNSLSSFAQTKPNVVLVLTDDLGYGDLSCLNNNSKIHSTNIDKFASEGAIFTDAHSSSSVSTPSRYSLLTGRYNWRSTLKQGVLSGFSGPMIGYHRETIAKMLKHEGYTTACIGKWHLGWNWQYKLVSPPTINYKLPVLDGPTTRGFDYFYGFCGSLDMPPYVYVENDMVTAIPDRETENKVRFSWWRKGETAPDFKHEEVLDNLVDRACAYVKDKKRTEPYFLYLPLPAPHTPILPSKKYQGKSGIGAYGDFVLMVDDLMGKLQQAIKDSGEEDNTIFIFTSDNGCSPAAGIKDMEKKDHFSNYIYRGTKADLFDGGHRIPCIVKWPKVIKPHTVNQTICLTDFYATLAAINHYSPKSNECEDSYNILPLFKDVKEKKIIREATVHHSVAGQFTIRKGDWKLLMSPSSGGWSYPMPHSAALKDLPPIQLYNMKDDPSEKNNVYNEHPEIVKELKSLLMKYIWEGRSTPGKAQTNDGPKVWNELNWMMSGTNL